MNFHARRQNPSCDAIILSYCDRDVFEKIDVALNQSHEFNQIIVVDDGSPKDFISELTQYVENNSRVNLIIHGVNKGVVSAMISGIKSVKSDYFYMMSCGDIYSDSILKNYCQIDWSAGYPGVIASGIYTTSKKKTIYKKYIQNSRKNYLYKNDQLLNLIKISKPIFYGGGCIVRSNFGLKAVDYIDNLDWAADLFLYYYAAFFGGVIFLDSFQMTYLVHENRLSAPSDFKKIIKVNCAFVDSAGAVGKNFYKFCLNGSVLPSYSVRTLLTIFFSKQYREYLNLNIIYLSLSHSLGGRVSAFIPHELKLLLRKIIRA